ncbi:MAG: ergothioneine biosynthesis protein EgtC [Sandaracinus sp.]|nr:ergothioneine biosynthesis protein EgtC [Sandaracinus sp.]MAQ15998.1 ergothioneine biosynthesis protein EgtC [Sandaracinus sp.]|tara:strand:- start:5294 stop:6058 length:765 start_codon:yes stop_codon:yes gene_type:complete
MCRVLAYVGAPRSLAELLVEPAHSLEVQSYAPKEMEEALLNADGFGVAWYTAGREEPARYRTILPMWADQNVRDFAGHVRSGHVLAAVRSATPGIGHGLANTQPFVHGPLTFLHNGFIRDFRRGAARRLREGLGDAAYHALGGNSDSEHLFGVFLDDWLEHGDLVRGLQETLRRADAARDGARALLSLVVSDGTTVAAVTQAFDGTAPTLYRRNASEGTLIASEPTSPSEGWTRLEPGVVTTVTMPPASPSDSP